MHVQLAGRRDARAERWQRTCISCNLILLDFLELNSYICIPSDLLFLKALSASDSLWNQIVDLQLFSWYHTVKLDLSTLRPKFADFPVLIFSIKIGLRKKVFEH